MPAQVLDVLEAERQGGNKPSTAVTVAMAMAMATAMAVAE
jgi:hypothetical protein